MPKTVLIVDDEPRITMALMTRLQACGYEVYHAINGLAGVEAAAIHHPDVVIMDIRMPDIDGYEACMRIHRLPDLAQTPIVFLSANAHAMKDKAMEVGGAAFLRKPYEAMDVISTIERVLSEASDANKEAA